MVRFGRFLLDESNRVVDILLHTSVKDTLAHVFEEKHCHLGSFIYLHFYKLRLREGFLNYRQIFFPGLQPYARLF